MKSNNEVVINMKFYVCNINTLYYVKNIKHCYIIKMLVNFHFYLVNNSNYLLRLRASIINIHEKKITDRFEKKKHEGYKQEGKGKGFNNLYNAKAKLKLIDETIIFTEV